MSFYNTSKELDHEFIEKMLNSNHGIHEKKQKKIQSQIWLHLKFEFKSPIPFKTITFDNGTEFTAHEDITKEYGIETYFAHPYHSWERGLNENTNGLIRQYLPKRKAFNGKEDSEIRQIEQKINNRPRKTLEFLSPVEFYNTKFNLTEVAFES